MNDPYAILGLQRGASPEEIRAAFRRLARDCHPDRNPGNVESQERFKQINAAYQDLTDGGPKGPAFRTQPPASNGPRTRPAGLGDLFADLINGATRPPTDRGDLSKELSLTFQEAAFGCTKKLRYQRRVLCSVCEGTRGEPGSEMVVCRTCRGLGRIVSGAGAFGLRIEAECGECTGVGRLPQKECSACAGVGLAFVTVERDVVVPPGIEPGATQTLAGAGNYASAGRPPGDLEVVINVAEHDVFQRDGDDVQSDLTVAFTLAARGGDMDVPTVHGVRKVRIPEGTETGTELRIRGAGVPRRRGGTGDHVVRVKLRIPERLSRRASELIREFDAAVGEYEESGLLGKLRGLFSE